jgi:ethanolamine ammonia-lyase small subunit
MSNTTSDTTIDTTSDSTRNDVSERVRDTPRALVQDNPWQALRRFTDARIALGRVGASLPTTQVLEFGVAHALARDAVYAALDVPRLAADLTPIAGAPIVVRSEAADRREYLLRPDLGRVLYKNEGVHEASPLRAIDPPPDVVFVLADGLSAVAVQQHAAPLLAALLPLLPRGWRVSPPVIATQARVAIGDDIGEYLGARVAVVLIGERPGLSAADSLGAYLTFDPRRGRTNAERNCVSNIRPAGLPYADAARRIAWLVSVAVERRLTGVGLADESDSTPLPPALTSG